MNRPPTEFRGHRGLSAGRGARVVFGLLLGFSITMQVAGFPELLTTVADVRLLSRDQAELSKPVKVCGVVTWREPWENFTIQDDTAGIWINVGEARLRELWSDDDGTIGNIREGMEVEIEGQSDPGGYAPVIIPTKLRIIGPGELPRAVPIAPSRFFSGSDDCQRIEIQGVVQGFLPSKYGVTLIMDANPGSFSAEVSQAAAPDPASLVDAVVRLRGVGATVFNTRGEVTGSRVLTSVAGDLEVLSPPPGQDAVPSVTLDRLLPFRAEPLGPHRVKVEGTVTYSLPGKFFYLQEGASAVRVETSSSVQLKPGDRVEATGFVEMSRLIGTLTDAMVRVTGAASLPEPVEISPEEILAINEAAVATAQVALPHDFDGHLIRCRAQLLAVQSDPDEKGLRSITLERANTLGKGSFIFRALFDDVTMTSLGGLQSGSELELTGLVQLDYAPNELTSRVSRTVPIGLNLILRSASDVRVLSSPSWWTAGHLTAVLAAVLVVLGGVMFWSLQLKRQVRRKTKLLGSSEKSVGELWFGKISKGMKQRDLQQVEATVAICLSHAQIDPQVEPLDDAA